MPFGGCGFSAFYHEALKWVDFDALGDVEGNKDGKNAQNLDYSVPCYKENRSCANRSDNLVV